MNQSSSVARRPRPRGAAIIASRLTLEGIGRRFGTTIALEGIDLDITPGEVVALLGHSGCGKTTLLRIAAGVDRPDRGSVRIDGRIVADDRNFLPPEKRGVGLMFQDYALFPHMTNRANVMFGLTALNRATASQEAETALARVGLKEYGSRYPHQLSGGEQQRVALARAMAPRPGVLLMDEPFSGLDQRLRESVRDETLTVLRETRATAVVVTHDPEEAMRVADRIVLMRRGRIVQEGNAETLYDRPSSLFAARYFSPLNEIAGIVRGGLAQTPVGDFKAHGLAEGTPVIAAVRPSGIETFPSEIGRKGPIGRVVGRRFLGEIDHIEVAVEGLDTYLTARVRSRSGLRPGDEIVVGFDLSDVLVFPAEP